MTLIVVALPIPLHTCFDYLPHVNTAEHLPFDDSTHRSLPIRGSRVRVPFGSRKIVGIVMGYKPMTQADVSPDKLKPIIESLDDTSILSDDLLTLAQWLSAYYHHPIGEVFSVMLPTLIRQGKSLIECMNDTKQEAEKNVQKTYWRLSADYDINSISKRATKQRHVFLLIQAYLQRTGVESNRQEHRQGHSQEHSQEHKQEHGEVSEQELLDKNPDITKAHLRKLEALHLIERRIIRSHDLEKNLQGNDLLRSEPLSLNEEQQDAVHEVTEIIESTVKNYKGFLLHGITGSGKTEVYLQMMYPVLKANKQVLILVPEIGLTPQTQSRFEKRFNTSILMLHSAMTDKARMRGWLACAHNEAKIIIATRSALLYSFANLGMIIVDEAHDSSYKQQDRLKYHAGDVALYRGLQLKIPVILGTATPTLEHLLLTKQGKLTELRLTKRPGNSKPPIFGLVDARQPHMTYITKADGTEQNTGLTKRSIEAIEQTLSAGKQVLIFLNRRGYAPVLLCDACGWQANCPRCDAHLTVHKNKPSRIDTGGYGTNQDLLQCHHCSWQIGVPSSCPDCASNNLTYLGIGTSRLHESLHAIFANPQTTRRPYPLIQIDRDSTRNKDSWKNIYEQIHSNEPAILIGTQMIAKGHHFPNVTLVVMPDADRGFLSSNFRSPEHTAQLIVQVAGRAGRGDSPGKVLIQTCQPENPLLIQLIKDGYALFADKLLDERQKMGLPPYVKACLVQCEGNSPKRTFRALQDAINILPMHHRLAVSGVVDAPMAKKNGRYHSHVLLLSNDRKHLHHVLKTWWIQVLALPSTKYLRLSIDIDPVSW